MAHTIKLRGGTERMAQPKVRPLHLLHQAQLEPIIGIDTRALSPAMEDKVRKAKEHYSSLDAESVFRHAVTALHAAGRGKLLDLSAGENDRLSLELADQILYHSLSSESRLPSRGLSDAFLRRFHIHNQLRTLDSTRGERMQDYVRLLNDQSNNVTDLLLALYTRIADMMTIHDPATATAASTKMPGVFLVHSSWEDVKVALADPMLRIYCPIADWGGQTAAYREMRDNAVRYLHPVEFQAAAAEVRRHMAALQNTNRMLRIILQDVSERLGLKVLMAPSYPAVSQALPHVRPDTVAVATRPFKGVGGLLNKHLKTGMPLERIHDWAGATIITDSQESMYRIVAFLQGGAIRSAGRQMGVDDMFINPPTDHAANPKPITRYRSVHTDVVSANPNMVPLELIVRTVRMHRWADEGEASHDGYKGCPLVNGERRRFMARMAEITAGA